MPVFSDECYVEFTWAGPGHTILEHGPEGVVAVHSLSKRSNLAGLRAGFFAGDADLVGYLSRLRQHAGFMVPGPVQHAGAVALGDDEHVDRQTGRSTWSGSGVLPRCWATTASTPRFPPVFLPLGSRSRKLSCRPQARATRTPAWALTRWLARHGGVLVAPGDTYGPAGAGHVRVAIVQPDDRLELVAEAARARRLAVAEPRPGVALEDGRGGGRESGATALFHAGHHRKITSN